MLHKQYIANRTKVIRDRETEEEAAARREAWRVAKARLRQGNRICATDIESADELDDHVSNQLDFELSAALIGTDKQQFAQVQGMRDYVEYSHVHNDHDDDFEGSCQEDCQNTHDDDQTDAPSLEQQMPPPTLPASMAFGQMIYGGHITKSKMQDLLGKTLRSLAVGDSIPLSLLPDSVDAIEQDLQGAVETQFVAAEHIKRRVCNQCGTSWPTTLKMCPGLSCTKNKTQKPKVITATKWKLHEQLRAFVENPASALHVLDHTLNGLRHSSLLKAKRNRLFHKIMDEVGSQLEPRNMVLILHYDGFAPFAMAENHSVGYLLVQVITAATFRAKQVSVIPWYIFGGPDHLVSLEPFEASMLEDLRICFDGFECHWPIPGVTECTYREKEFELREGRFTVRAVIGLSVSDQPAAAMIGGWAFHGAYLSCRWGGPQCIGSKLTKEQEKERPSLIPKGKAKSDKEKKRGRAQGARNMESVEPMELNASGDGSGRVDDGHHKSGATVWLTDWQTLQAQTSSTARDVVPLLEQIEDIAAQRNKTETRAFISELGFRRRTFVWTLYEWYGFDPLLDMPPDFMHLAMGLLKDYLHIKVSMLSLLEKQCPNMPDLKEFFKTFRACSVSAFTSGRRFLRSLDHVAVSDASAEEMLVYLRLEGDCVFHLLEPCVSQLDVTLRAHFEHVKTGWSKLRQMLCGFLDKRDKVDMVEWASGMRELVLDYLSHLQYAKVGEVYTFSHGYRTFTSHLVQHLPSYCEEWNDVFEWWCFVYERFAGVLTKKLRCFNKNTGVDVHLGSCLSMEAAIWRHLSMEEIELDREVMADASAIDCAGHTGSFQERDTLGLGGGASVELHGRAVQLWNLFTVDGVTYAGGRTQKEVLALPGYRQLIRPRGKGKKSTPAPLLAVIASSSPGNFHLDIVDALAKPRGHVTHYDHQLELSVYRLDLEAEPKPGELQEVMVPGDEVNLTLKPAWQHQRVVLLIPMINTTGTEPQSNSPVPHMLVDPGATFHMIRATEHVFRDRRNSDWVTSRMLKQCRILEDDLRSQDSVDCDAPLVSVDASKAQQMSAVAGVVHRECDSFFVNTQGLTRLEVEAVTHASTFKPNIRPHSQAGCVSMLHKELSCCGFKAMWQRVLELLPNHDDNGIMFGDIGSGCGQVRAHMPPIVVLATL